VSRRKLEDFKKDGVNDEIAGLRLTYYEDKRKVLTKEVEQTIKSGLINDVKQM